MTKTEKSFIPLLDFYELDPKKTSSGAEVTCECVFSDCESSKLFMNVAKGLWQCKVCHRKGNAYVLLDGLYQAMAEGTTSKDLARLTELVKGWTVPGLKAARVVHDGITDNFYIPCFNFETGKVVSLCKIVVLRNGKVKVYRPPNVKGEIPMYPFTLNKGTEEMYVCEGEKDAIALVSKLTEEGEDHETVLGIPGAGTFKDGWLSIFKGKLPTFMYDFEPNMSGTNGMIKAIDAVVGRAADIFVVDWSKIANSVDDKIDVRDFLNSGKTIDDLEDLVVPADEWGPIKEILPEIATVKDGVKVKKKNDFADLREDIDTFPQLMDSLRERLHYKNRAERAIAVSLSTVISTVIPGPPVWMFVVAPASAGKTTVIDGMGLDNEFFYQVSKFGPKVLISGAGGKNEDYSLIPRLQNRCLGIKDFTPILDMPNMVQAELYGVLRDCYDGHASIAYGTGAIRTYDDIHWSVLAGVTDEVRRVNNTAMGERFIRINYIDPSESHFEQTMMAIADRDEGDDESTYDFVRKRILGFYKKKIAEVCSKDSEGVWKPNFIPRFDSYELQKMLGNLGEVTAAMRTQVARNRSSDITYTPSPELGGRLGVQFKKLAQGLAYIMDQKSINEVVYPLVAQCAVDTANPHYHEIIKLIVRTDNSCSERSIRERTGVSKNIVNRILHDMHALRILSTPSSSSNSSGMGGRRVKKWSVEPDFLYQWKTAFPPHIKVYE